MGRGGGRERGGEGKGEGMGRGKGKGRGGGGGGRCTYQVQSLKFFALVHAHTLPSECSQVIFIQPCSHTTRTCTCSQGFITNVSR